jgi:hypothetical protein
MICRKPNNEAVLNKDPLLKNVLFARAKGNNRKKGPLKQPVTSFFFFSSAQADDEIRVTSGCHGTVYVMSRAVRPLISFLGRQSH